MVLEEPQAGALWQVRLVGRLQVQRRKCSLRELQRVFRVLVPVFCSQSACRQPDAHAARQQTRSHLES